MWSAREVQAIVVTIAAAGLMQGAATWLSGGQSIVASQRVHELPRRSSALCSTPFAVYVFVVVALLLELACAAPGTGEQSLHAGRGQGSRARSRPPDHASHGGRVRTRIPLLGGRKRLGWRLQRQRLTSACRDLHLRCYCRRPCRRQRRRRGRESIKRTAMAPFSSPPSPTCCWIQHRDPVTVRGVIVLVIVVLTNLRQRSR